MKTTRFILLFFICPWLFGAKAPFRVLYNNDTTNVESCTAPFHAKGAPFTVAAFLGSVDEAAKAGADAHFLSPGLTWVPLWKSQIYPPAAHMQWWKTNFNNGRGNLSSIGNFILNGGDLLQEYVDHCNANAIAAFVSLRMNDYHYTEYLDVPDGNSMTAGACLGVDQFRREHVEWRLFQTLPPDATDQQKREAGMMNWAVPEVRARLLGFVREVCEGYAIDGLELDFMRHFRMFPDDLPNADRALIVKEFVAEVRQILDETAPEGKHRWLCARVSSNLTTQAALGIDLPQMCEAGLEMINLSVNYYTVQDGHDFAQIRAANPDASIYLEMTHTTYVGPDQRLQGGATGDSDYYRRTTDEQYYTAALRAYDAGLDGVSLFNFAYYREYGNSAARGPFNEPPFHIINRLKYPYFINSTSQHYILTPLWRSPYSSNNVQISLHMNAGRRMSFTMHLVKPAQGWKNKPARIRVQSFNPMPDGQTFNLSCNGVPLSATSDLSEPYPNPYPPLLGDATSLRAWELPVSLLKEGVNTFEIHNPSPLGTDKVEIRIIDMALEASCIYDDYTLWKAAVESDGLTVSTAGFAFYEGAPNLPNALIIGDSVSIGYTLETRSLLAGRMNVYRVPANAQNTSYTLLNFDTWLSGKKWDVIYCNWGLHDLTSKGPQPPGYGNNLRLLVDKLRATGAKVVFATTTPIPADSIGRAPGAEIPYNIKALEVMLEKDVLVDDLYSYALPLLKKIQRPADVHFSNHGSNLLAQRVSRAIHAAYKGDGEDDYLKLENHLLSQPRPAIMGQTLSYEKTEDLAVAAHETSGEKSKEAKQ